MEFTGIAAIGFVVLTFLAGLVAGLVFAGWIIAIMLRRSGMQMVDGGLIVPIREVSDE